MKRRPFTILFVAVNVSFVFLQIYKYSCWSKALYERQEDDAKKKAMLVQKNMLFHKRCILNDPHEVKQYAQRELNMAPVRISQVKTLQGRDGKSAAS